MIVHNYTLSKIVDPAVRLRRAMNKYAVYHDSWIYIGRTTQSPEKQFSMHQYSSNHFDKKWGMMVVLYYTTSCSQMENMYNKVLRFAAMQYGDRLWFGSDEINDDQSKGLGGCSIVYLLIQKR